MNDGATSMVILEDIERAIAVRDPELGALVVRYLAQDDPEDGRGELSPSEPDDEDDEDAERAGEPPVHVPPGAYTIDRLTSAVSPDGLANQTPTERKLARLAAFAAAET
jgi:hypothetical protein